MLLVVVGAPLIEELLYRGLLLGAFRRRVDDLVALVAVALWFTAHPLPSGRVPGLLVVGLVLGACVLVTDRLGMSVLAQALAFNATGLIWVAAPVTPGSVPWLRECGRWWTN